MQQVVPASQALMQISHDFETSVIGERRKNTPPAPLGDLCFRLLNFRAVIENDHLRDPEAIRETAVQMEGEIEAWQATLPRSWRCSEVDVTDAPAGTCFGGKRHIYSNPWTAQIWNNWRTLRILINRIILQNEIRSGVPDSVHASTALSHIQQSSTEICISAPSFIGSPRKHESPHSISICSWLKSSVGSTGIMWPLLVVSQEHVNSHHERCWAVDQLRRICSTMGIRHAGLLADTVSQSLNES